MWCPFTRVVLEEKVYPLDEKKKQVKEFKFRRDTGINTIATKLIVNEKFTSFAAVLEAVEDYLKDLGDSNYLPLARELADIWSGLDGNSNNVLLFIFVDELNGVFCPNKWWCVLETGNIEYDVGKILVAAEHVTIPCSEHRNRFALALYNERGVLADRCEIFQHHKRSWVSSNFHLFDEIDSIVAKARISILEVLLAQLVCSIFLGLRALKLMCSNLYEAATSGWGKRTVWILYKYKQCLTRHYVSL